MHKIIQSLGVYHTLIDSLCLTSFRFSFCRMSLFISSPFFFFFGSFHAYLLRKFKIQNSV